MGSAEVTKQQSRYGQQQDDRSGWVYILDSNIEAHRGDDIRIYKIGRAKQLDMRIKQLGTLYAYQPQITYVFPTDDRFRDESALHCKFADKRMNGEWFRLGYEDLGFIANEFATCSGYIEADNGVLLPDPFRPVDPDIEAIQLIEAELEANPVFARSVKYLPLQRFRDYSNAVCPIEEGLCSAEAEKEQERADASWEEQQHLEDNYFADLGEGK